MTKPRAYHLTEGDWFVRGTTDLKVVAGMLEDEEDVYYCAPEDVDWKVVLDGYTVGRWRFTPCGPSSCGEHGWHLTATTKFGRGTFEGVQVHGVQIETVEFACDEEEIP